MAVHFEGEAAGVKLGGMLDEAIREVTVKGWSWTSPSTSCIDISALGMGDDAKVSDLLVPEGVEILDDPEEILCSVISPRERRRLRKRRGGREECRGRPSPRSSARARGRRGLTGPPGAPGLTRLSRGALRPQQQHASTSSSAWAIPGRRTRAPVTTSATWSSTSWRVGTASRGQARLRGRVAEGGVAGRAVAAAAAHHVHERLRAQRRGGAARTQAAARPRAGGARPHRPAVRPAAPAANGGNGGHNGLKSITGLIGNDYARLRVGVDRPASSDPDVVADYVLSRFAESRAEVEALVARAADAVELWLDDRARGSRRRVNGG